MSSWKQIYRWSCTDEYIRSIYKVQLLLILKLVIVNEGKGAILCLGQGPSPVSLAMNPAPSLPTNTCHLQSQHKESIDSLFYPATGAQV